MQQARHLPDGRQTGDDFGRYLLGSGLITASALLEARNIQAICRTSLDRILISEGQFSADEMITALSRFHGLPRVDLARAPAAPGTCRSDPAAALPQPQRPGLAPFWRWHQPAYCGLTTGGFHPRSQPHG